MPNNRDLEDVHWPSSDERPDPAEHLVWSVPELCDALATCAMSRVALSGQVAL